MDAKLDECVIAVPVGFKVSIEKVPKIGSVRGLRVINGLKDKTFFAIFDEEDVDFQIRIDNRLCCRGIGFELMINNKSHTYYIIPGKMSVISALETNGRKLHFKSQNTNEGQLLVAATAHKHGISCAEAENICSKIVFHIDVERLIETPFCNFENMNILGLKIRVIIQTLAGKSVDIDVGTDNTLLFLKRKFAEKEGTSTNLTLIFNSKQLEGNKTLRDYDIVNNSTLYVIFNSNTNVSDRIEFSSNFESERNRPSHQIHHHLNANKLSPTFEALNESHQNQRSLGVHTPFSFGSTQLKFSRQSSPLPLNPQSLSRSMFHSASGASPLTYSSSVGQSEAQVFSGERGVICYGEKSDQKFTPYNGFVKDFNLLINDFTIELRMASKYEPI